MAELQRAHHQPRDDLVADAEHHHRVEGVVRQRDRGAHRDRIAREQRQLHAGIALRDAVAHRRHAAGDLRHRAHFTRRRADQRGIALIGLVRGQHVVVRGDDAEIQRMFDAQLQLVGGRQRGVAMSQVGAGQALCRAQFALRAGAALQVGAAAGAATFDDARGDVAHGGIESLWHSI